MNDKKPKQVAGNKDKYMNTKPEKHTRLPKNAKTTTTTIRQHSHNRVKGYHRFCTLSQLIYKLNNIGSSTAKIARFTVETKMKSK